LGSPVRAFLGTRDARAALARRSADRANTVEKFCYEPEHCVPLKQVVIELRACHTAIPLGWSLSEGAKQEIRDQILGTTGEHPAGAACPKTPDGGRWPDQLGPVLAALGH